LAQQLFAQPLRTAAERMSPQRSRYEPSQHSSPASHASWFRGGDRNALRSVDLKPQVRRQRAELEKISRKTLTDQAGSMLRAQHQQEIQREVPGHSLDPK